MAQCYCLLQIISQTTVLYPASSRVPTSHMLDFTK